MNRTGSWKALVPLFAALLYGASPLDLIPDLIPLIGLVDDAFVLPMLLLLSFVQMRRSKRIPAQVTVHPRA